MKIDHPTEFHKGYDEVVKRVWVKMKIDSGTEKIEAQYEMDEEFNPSRRVDK